MSSTIPTCTFSYMITHPENQIIPRFQLEPENAKVAFFIVKELSSKTFNFIQSKAAEIKAPIKFQATLKFSLEQGLEIEGAIDAKLRAYLMDEGPTIVPKQNAQNLERLHVKQDNNVSDSVKECVKKQFKTQKNFEDAFIAFDYWAFRMYQESGTEESISLKIKIVAAKVLGSVRPVKKEEVASSKGKQPAEEDVLSKGLETLQISKASVLEKTASGKDKSSER